jgi:putative sugar O-methyltransferase
MFDDLATSPSVVRPSAYWEHINARNLEQLAQGGFERFKRTINQNYFAFVPSDVHDDQFQAVLRSWCRHPSLPVLLPRGIDATGLQTIFQGGNPLGGRRLRLVHAMYLALLWEFVRRRDRLGLLDALEEPALGSPITITYRGRHISQDLCNSVHEFYSMESHLARVAAPPYRVLELGGGYGRIAWVFANAFPDVRYILCDIPPALAVAQRYLTTLFPGRSVFTFRRFETFAEVADEFERAHFAFITPGQLALLPPVEADLFVNVSSLHEMRMDQFDYYLRMADRHCRGLVYTKQWQVSKNEHDGLVVRRADYPIPAHWEELYSRSHEIQTQFFEALYRVGVA